MRTRVAAFLALAFLVTVSWTGQAEAQVPWDAPSLRPPGNPSGLGIYLLDSGASDTGVLMTYQRPGTFGFRLGLVDGPGRDNSTVLGGVEFSGPISHAGADSRLLIDWVAGVGAGLGDFTIVSVPFGLTVGGTFQGDGASFTPWIGAKLVLDGYFGDQYAGDDTDLNVGVDLGIDLKFTEGWLVRVGASLADRDAIAIGIVF